LAELWAVRLCAAESLPCSAEATAENRQLLPDSVLKIRDQADARKIQQARKLLDNFFAREGKESARMP